MKLRGHDLLLPRHNQSLESQTQQPMFKDNTPTVFNLLNHAEH